MPDPKVVPVKSATNGWLMGLLNVIGLSVACAAVFLYVELLFSVQSPHWAGGELQDWIETAQAFGMYVSLLAVAALVPYCVIAPFLMLPSLRQALSIVLPIGAALGLCVYIDSVIEAIPIQFRIGVPAVLAGIALIAVVFALARVAQPVNVGLLVSIAISGGIATLYLALIEHLLDAERTQAIVTPSLLWFSMSTLGALIVWLITVNANPRWPIRMVSTFVLCSLYPGLLFSRPYIDLAVNERDSENLLLITVDTLRADVTSTYGGSVPTPNIDALAASGTVFEQHYALAPWTVPSINALMTSKYPPSLTPGASSEQRAVEETSYHRMAGYWLDRDGVTFTKRLGNVGYNTAAVYANPTIEFQEWLTLGFKGSRMVGTLGKEREPVRFRQTPLLREVVGQYRPEFLEERALDSSAAVTQYGLAYLRRYRGEPFALWLHFMDPHTPYDPPERFRQVETPWPQFLPDGAENGGDADTLYNDEERRAAQSLYEAEVRYVDDCVGRILSELRRLGLTNDTLVCFTSDHGEEFWEHNRWGHGYDFYDEQVHVPLIFAGPHILHNRIDAPVSAIDVLPTIAELLGSRLNPDWHGASLAASLRSGEAVASRPVFAQATHFFRYNPEPTQMVIDGNYKFLLGLESGTRRLYDLSDDPGEETNLADSLPEVVERLHGQLEVWSASFPSNFDEVAGWRGNGQPLAPDENLEETLKALGYSE